jgi:protein-S-isoprenylcysteine O-methyltransferase Ste14
MKNTLRHLSSFIAPVVMGGVLPALIVWSEHRGSARPLLSPYGLLVPGLVLAVATIRMFVRMSQGTIIPWNPSRKLVTASLYGHVRNPMILSLILLQIGEALMFASIGIGVLALVFFIINTLYFVFSEEPGLEKRFGGEYVEYKQNVPRWIPRLKTWRPTAPR